MRSFNLLDQSYPAPEKEKPEIEREETQADNIPGDRQTEMLKGWTLPEKSPDEPIRQRVRDPVDSAGGLGLAGLGALTSIAERLFDGFLGGGESRKPPTRRTARDTEERQDKAHRAANSDDRKAEEADARARHERGWQDRSRRWRGRD